MTDVHPAAHDRHACDKLAQIPYCRALLVRMLETCVLTVGTLRRAPTDLGVGPALADGHGDLALAVVEQGQALQGAGAPVVGGAGHPVDQPPGDGRGQDR